MSYRKITEIEAIEFYNSMLDDCYPKCKVAGYEYDTSDALKRLDPIAYDQGLLDYLDSEELEIEED